jgi:hypothetical protein
MIQGIRSKDTELNRALDVIMDFSHRPVTRPMDILDDSRTMKAILKKVEQGGDNITINVSAVPQTPSEFGDEVKAILERARWIQ